MSDAAYMVLGLAIVAVVAVVLGVLALFFGRAVHMKGGGINMVVKEPSPPVLPPLPTPATKPQPTQGKKRQRHR
jgi:hypothetical protein